MNRRNRCQEKNKRSRSQKAGKQKSRKNSPLPTNQRTHLRNESEYSPKRFLAEYSDKGVSGQYLRPNIHPIYQYIPPHILPSLRPCYILTSEVISRRFPRINRLIEMCHNRPFLKELLAFVRSGDTVAVWKLDRLGRSLKDLIETLNLLKDRGIDFISLFADPNHSIPEICSTLGISRSTLYRYVREAKKASGRPE